MNDRKLKDGTTAKRFDKKFTLGVVTDTPQKWKLTDLESGEEYIGNTQVNENSLSWQKSKLYALWKQHLSLNSRLTEQQQIKRAKEFTRKGMKP